MKNLNNTISSGLLAVSTALAGPVAIGTLSGCDKPGVEGSIIHSHRTFSGPDEMMANCSAAISNKTKFDTDGQKIVCEQYFLGKPENGGLVETRKIRCDEIVKSTREEIGRRFFTGNVTCFAPNFKGWPAENLGPAFKP